MCLAKVTLHQPTRFALLSPQLALCWGAPWACGRVWVMTVPAPSLLQIPPTPCSSGGGPNALSAPPLRGGGRRGPSASSSQLTCHNALGGRLIGRPDRGLHSAKEQGSPCCKMVLWAACSQPAELWKAGLGQGTAVSGASLGGERQVWVEGQKVPDIVLWEVNGG